MFVSGRPANRVRVLICSDVLTIRLIPASPHPGPAA
jgi:hypothetical protein